MTSVDKIFSRFLALVTDYNLAALDESDLYDMELEWLQAAAANPRFRQKFNTFRINDDEITYELKNPLDEYSDDEFVTRYLSIAMAVEWLRPQVDSVLFTSPFIGGKEEKKLLDHHSAEIERLYSLEKELKKMLRDRGYYYNDYVEGT